LGYHDLLIDTIEIFEIKMRMRATLEDMEE